MAHRVRIIVAVLWIATALIAVDAQVPSRQTGVSKAKAGANPANAEKGEVDPLLRQRKETAVGLLNALADEARDYHNRTWSARVQARVADALWETDKERARALFRRAWDVAVVVDGEAQRKSQGQTRGLYFLPNLREEILKLAARRDHALGEEFLAKFTQEKEQQATVTGPAQAEDPTSFMSPTARTAAAQRLTLARQLLKSGDAERAIQFADPALDRVTLQGITFLTALRSINAQAADARYAAMLSRVTIDPSADANVISLLSSYAFTPFLYVTVLRGQIMSGQMEPPAPAPALAPQLRAAFFEAAAQVFLRPLPLPDQDRTTSGRAGLYFIISRLLPLFEQYAPGRAPALRTQLAALSPDAPESYRNGTEEALNQGLAPDANTRDELQVTLDQLANASDTASRDRLYASAAIAAAQKGDPRAGEFADKISDGEVRQRVRAYVDFAAVKRAIDKKDAPEAERLARGKNLTPAQRAWALTMTTRLLLKTDPAHAYQLLNEAITEARHINEAEPGRVNALISVANRFWELDRNRAWEMMLEIVKAANTANNFVGENGQIGVRLQTQDGVYMNNFSVTDFDLAGIFGSLAKDDLGRAVDTAKGIEGETPRAIATLAIARSVLNEKLLSAKQ